MLVDVVGLRNGVTAIATGREHTCALTSAGGVKCWGRNEYSQIGEGKKDWRYLAPVDVPGLRRHVTAIGAGDYHSCAVTDRGAVRCWGDMLDCAMTTDIDVQLRRPTEVEGLSQGATAIDAGMCHTCVVTTGGGAQCWGRNDAGQLGDGTEESTWTPVGVNGLSRGVVDIRPGALHTCALMTSGGVRCWGNNEYGQLGDGTTTDSLTPVAVAGLAGGSD